MSNLHLARIQFLNPDGTVSRPWLLHLLRENELLLETSAISNSARQMSSMSIALGDGSGGDGEYEYSMIPGPMGLRGADGANGIPGMDGEDSESIMMLPPSNTGQGNYTDLNVTGNTTLGDAATDTLNVGAGGIIKDAAGNVGIGATPSAWSAGLKALETNGGALVGATTTYYLVHNLYYNAGWFYKADGAACVLSQSGLLTNIYTAPVGVAGAAATLTVRLAVNASLISTSNPLSVTNTTESTTPTTGAVKSAGGLGVAKAIVGGTTIRSGGYTVATLPAGVVGDRAYVSDALAPAYGVPVAGGGAIIVPVFRNATVWICT